MTDWLSLTTEEFAPDAHRGAAGRGGRAARAASAGRRRYLHRGGLSGARARAAAGGFAGGVPAGAGGRRVGRASGVSRHADALARNRAARLHRDRRERAPRRHPQARHHQQPWRQHHADRSRGAAAARAPRHAGGARLVGPLRLSGRACSAEAERTHGIHGGDIETSIMLAAYPDLVRRDKIADFRPATYAMERDYAYLRADYPGRLRLDDAGPARLRARSAMRRSRRPKRARRRSTTARAPSWRCWTMWRNSIWRSLAAGPLAKTMQWHATHSHGGDT